MKIVIIENTTAVLLDFCRYWSKLVDMRMDNKHSHPSQLLRHCLIALVVYFSQIYPYVHFHHAHAESDTPIYFCLHPVEVEPNQSHHAQSHDDFPHQSGDTHHHHHEFHQHIDWHLVRTHSNSILSHIEFAYISVQLEMEPTPTSTPRYSIVASTPLPDSVVLDGIDTRGPPVLG